MIKSVEIKNFQGFAGVHDVRLAPITVILGANATGKSTLGRILKLLAQSPNGVLEFAGKNIDLVRFNKALFGQLGDETKPTELCLAVTLPLRAYHFAAPKSPGDDGDDDYEDHFWDNYLARFAEVFTQKHVAYLAANLQTFAYFEVGLKNEDRSFQVPVNHLVTGFIFTEPKTGEEFKFGFGKKSTGRFTRPHGLEDMVMLGESIETSTVEMKRTLETLFTKTLDSASHPSLQMLLVSEGFDLPNDGINWFDLLFGQTYELEANGWIVDRNTIREVDPAENIRENFLGGILEAAAQARAEAFSSMFEVSGVRDYEHVPVRLDFSAENPVRMNDSNTRKAVNEALGKMTGNRYSVQEEESQTATSVRSLHTSETFILDNLTGAKVSFDNVGAGLGQILPILNGLFCSPNNKTLLIEQPELHLHPKAQADLAQVIVDAVLGENVEQVLLETHSETILLRLQRLIREGRIRNTDVAIVVTQEVPISEEQPDAVRGNMIYNLELTDDGEFTEPMLLSFAGVRLDEFL